MGKPEGWLRALRGWSALGCALLFPGVLAPAVRAQPGPAETTRIYDYCRARADAAFQSERHIDQDILATRSNDWRRAGTLHLQHSQMFAEAAGRADAVLHLCLRSHGAARTG